MINPVGNNFSASLSGRVHRPAFVSNDAPKSYEPSPHRTSSVFSDSPKRQSFFAQVDRSQWSHRHRFALENYQRVSESMVDSFAPSELLPRLDYRV
ncbi:MAG: hypothetical protein V4629_04145 [Pseudomonadota bacterium]